MYLFPSLTLREHSPFSPEGEHATSLLNVLKRIGRLRIPRPAWESVGGAATDQSERALATVSEVGSQEARWETGGGHLEDVGTR